jgi:glycosyltransferase involved in cell wall biosynthesis
VSYEVLIVDNNSTDETRQVVEQAISTSPVPLTYLFEPRQGVSNGRNTGIRNARAPIIAFTDDDCRPASNWIASIVRAFNEHTDVDCIGGRVVPRWPEKVPEWFTWRQVSPLALCEHGDQELAVHADNAAPCLITANLACRRSAFDRAGLFSPEYPRGQDREIQLRLWMAGCRGLYVPGVIVGVDVPPGRLTKEYFRTWFRRYGEVHARIGLLDVLDKNGRLVEPPPQRARLFGAPPYIYRELASAMGSWIVAAARVQRADTFYYENRARYLRNYLRTRFRDHRRVHQIPIGVELARFVSRRVRHLVGPDRSETTRADRLRVRSFSRSAASDPTPGR